jgi:hypothetical protein
MRRVSNGVLVVTLALVAGCYAPKVKNKGFACDGNYVGACPVGFACINGICDDGSGGTPPPPGPDMAMGDGTGGNGGGDMASAPDMAKPASSPDLAMPPLPDLAQPPPPDMASSCVHSPCVAGSKLNKYCDSCVTQVCTADPVCCSTTWDSICVGEVTSICGRSCP